MSADNPTQRADDKTLAVFVQRFNDFLDSTEKYRRVQEEMYERNRRYFEESQKTIADRLIVVNEKVFLELSNIKLTLARLPCDAHKALADQIHISLWENIKWLWRQVWGIWGAIGAASLAVFIAWLNIKK